MSEDAFRHEAMRLHGAGRLDEAAGLYRTLLQRDPRAFDLLVLMSVLEHQRNNAAAALEFATRSLQVRRSPEALLQQAVVLRACGRDREALANYDEVLAVRPDLPLALYNRGNLLRENGRHEEALVSYERLLAIDPDDVAALNNRAVALLELNRLDESLRSCEAALAIRPDHVDALNNRGNVLRRLGRLADAIESFSAALRIAPRDARVRNNRAAAYYQLERFEEALADSDRALALSPADADALNARGMSLQRLGRHEDALASYRRALARSPDATKAVNVGNALLAMERPEEALASYDQALALQPEHVGAWSNRGNALQVLQRHDEALASYRRASDLAPDDADAHWNEGLCRLALGEYERGWAKYEWRLAGRRSPPSGSNVSCARLVGGESLVGRTVLVHTEQGHGDALQFIRYVPLLAARGAKVVLACHESLYRLFASVDGVTTVLGADTQALPLLPLDYHVSVMSLPHVLGATQQAIPASVPYLRCSARQLERWRAKAAAFGPGPRIGLAWTGNPDFAAAHRKSVGLDELRPLLDHDSRFFSLQTGPAAADIGKHGLRDRILDLTGEIESFDDTAALVSNLDLVISIDTAVAHLAGALGKPVWILLQHAADWRWLLRREDSPWYPTARLFRQSKAGDWRDVVRRVNEVLGVRPFQGLAGASGRLGGGVPGDHLDEQCTMAALDKVKDQLK